MPGRQELITRRLQEAGRKSAALFRTLSDSDLAQVVYRTGPRWRARDVLAHFVSAEETLVVYGRDVLTGGSGAPEDFVIDDFNAIAVAGLRDMDAAALVERFEAARAATAEMAAGMCDADFDRVGRHPWFGLVPLEQMLKLIYRHNMLHERDVRRALETGQPVAHVDTQPPAEAGRNENLMSDRKEKLRQIIEADDATSMRIFRRLTPEQWAQPVPSDEGAEWKARDVLTHVAISEGGQFAVIQRVLSGQGGVPEDFDLNRYNRRSVQKQAERGVDDLLASLQRDHAQVLAALDGVSEADLDKTGRHARGDTLTVEQFFHRVTEHRRQHAEELARNLGLT